MAKYTTEEREKLVRRFEIQRAERRTALINEMRKMGDIFEARILRRAGLVPKMFAELKLKDVLGVEREHRVKIYELIKDVAELHKTQLHTITRELALKKEVEQLKRKRLTDVRSYQKRKESLAQGRVSKK